MTKGIMDHVREHFGRDYAPNTRETFRRQVLHQFVLGGVAEHNPFEPDLPTNSPSSHYAISEAALRVVQSFGTAEWESNVLYLGDTAKKDLHVDQQRLLEVGLPLTEHGKLPDIVLHDRHRDRLFLIEAVTSHGPVDRKRLTEFEALLKSCRAEPIYVSAFPGFDEFRQHMKTIAWETDVWLAEVPG